MKECKEEEDGRKRIKRFFKTKKFNFIVWEKITEEKFHKVFFSLNLAWYEYDVEREEINWSKKS